MNQQIGRVYVFYMSPRVQARERWIDITSNIHFTTSSYVCRRCNQYGSSAHDITEQSAADLTHYIQRAHCPIASLEQISCCMHVVQRSMYIICRRYSTPSSSWRLSPLTSSSSAEWLATKDRRPPESSSFYCCGVSRVWSTVNTEFCIIICMNAARAEYSNGCVKTTPRSIRLFSVSGRVNPLGTCPSLHMQAACEAPVNEEIDISHRRSETVGADPSAFSR